MKARLLILIVIAGGLAVYFAVGKNREPVVVEEDLPDEGPTAEELEDIRLKQKTLEERRLPGQEPPARPEVAVTVEVDLASGKNRLFFNVSEAHGYYVETFRILVWYKRPGVTGPDDSPILFEHYVNDYVKANETLRTCAEVVPAELARVGGNMGTTDNWDARIILHGRARVKNPDPLPPLARATSCD